MLRSKILSLILVILFLVALGFLLFSNITGIPQSQRFYFELEDFNNAWGYVHTGYYIDGQGNLYSYDRSNEPWEFFDHSSFTEGQLSEKYTSSKLIRSVPQEELLEKYQIALQIGRGKLSESKLTCFDFGHITFWVYVYNKFQGRYYPILIYRAGDYTQRNLSEDATTLFEWIVNLVGWEMDDLHCLPKN